MPDNANTVAIPQGSNSEPVVVRIPNAKSPIWHWILSALLAGGSVLATGYVNYTRNVEGVQTRLTVIETQQKNYESRFDRIEDKLDQLLLMMGTNERATQRGK